MATTNVPAQYQQLVSAAAGQLGLPVDVVAAQIQTESGWNPNAVSPTGAQGLAQFEPGTWATYGVGSPNDPTAAMNAYVKYMSALMVQFGGNVRNALAAYNAGPGNLPAGYGYADGILAQAKQGSGLLGVPGATGSGPAGGTAASAPNTQGVTSGGGTTCAFALGTKNKILIWHVDFSVCVISKTEVRALLGAMLLAGGAVIFMVGSALVMQYALDKTGTLSAAKKASGVMSFGR